MTVKKLIKALEKEDPNRIVICQSDPEGNSYSPLYDFWTGAYSPKSGNVGLDKLTPEDIAAGHDEDSIVKGKPALIFVPSH